MVRLGQSFIVTQGSHRLHPFFLHFSLKLEEMEVEGYCTFENDILVYIHPHVYRCPTWKRDDNSEQLWKTSSNRGWFRRWNPGAGKSFFESATPNSNDFDASKNRVMHRLSRRRQQRRGRCLRRRQRRRRRR